MIQGTCDVLDNNNQKNKPITRHDSWDLTVGNFEL